MDHFSYSIRRLLSKNREDKHIQKDFDGPVIRMSDLNTSNTDSIKNVKCSTMKKEKTKTPKSKKQKSQEDDTEKQKIDLRQFEDENLKHHKNEKPGEETTKLTENPKLHTDPKHKESEAMTKLVENEKHHTDPKEEEREKMMILTKNPKLRTNPTENESEKHTNLTDLDKSSNEEMTKLTETLNDIDLRKFVEDLSLENAGFQECSSQKFLDVKQNLEEYFNMELESFQYLFGKQPTTSNDGIKENDSLSTATSRSDDNTVKEEFLKVILSNNNKRTTKPKETQGIEEIHEHSSSNNDQLIAMTHFDKQAEFKDTNEEQHYANWNPNQNIKNHQHEDLHSSNTNKTGSGLKHSVDDNSIKKEDCLQERVISAHAHAENSKEDCFQTSTHPHAGNSKEEADLYYEIKKKSKTLDYTPRLKDERKSKEDQETLDYPPQLKEERKGKDDQYTLDYPPRLKEDDQYTLDYPPRLKEDDQYTLDYPPRLKEDVQTALEIHARRRKEERKNKDDQETPEYPPRLKEEIKSKDVQETLEYPPRLKEEIKSKDNQYTLDYPPRLKEDVQRALDIHPGRLKEERKNKDGQETLDYSSKLKEERKGNYVQETLDCPPRLKEERKSKNVQETLDYPQRLKEERKSKDDQYTLDYPPSLKEDVQRALDIQHNKMCKLSEEIFDNVTRKNNNSAKENSSEQKQENLHKQENLSIESKETIITSNNFFKTTENITFPSKFSSQTSENIPIFNNEEQHSLVIFNYEHTNINPSHSSEEFHEYKHFPLSENTSLTLRRSSKKEIITFDSHPNISSEKVRVVRMKITGPKGQKMCVDDEKIEGNLTELENICDRQEETFSKNVNGKARIEDVRKLGDDDEDSSEILLNLEDDEASLNQTDDASEGYSLDDALKMIPQDDLEDKDPAKRSHQNLDDREIPRNNQKNIEDFVVSRRNLQISEETQMSNLMKHLVRKDATRKSHQNSDEQDVRITNHSHTKDPIKNHHDLQDSTENHHSIKNHQQSEHGNIPRKQDMDFDESKTSRNNPHLVDDTLTIIHHASIVEENVEEDHSSLLNIFSDDTKEKRQVVSKELKKDKEKTRKVEEDLIMKNKTRAINFTECVKNRECIEIGGISEIKNVQMKKDQVCTNGSNLDTFEHYVNLPTAVKDEGENLFIKKAEEQTNKDEDLQHYVNLTTVVKDEGGNLFIKQAKEQTNEDEDLKNKDIQNSQMDQSWIEFKVKGDHVQKTDLEKLEESRGEFNVYEDISFEVDSVLNHKMEEEMFLYKPTSDNQLKQQPFGKKENSEHKVFYENAKESNKSLKLTKEEDPLNSISNSSTNTKKSQSIAKEANNRNSKSNCSTISKNLQSTTREENSSTITKKSQSIAKEANNRNSKSNCSTISNNLQSTREENSSTITKKSQSIAKEANNRNSKSNCSTISKNLQSRTREENSKNPSTIAEILKEDDYSSGLLALLASERDPKMRALIASEIDEKLKFKMFDLMENWRTSENVTEDEEAKSSKNHTTNSKSIQEEIRQGNEENHATNSKCNANEFCQRNEEKHTTNSKSNEMKSSYEKKENNTTNSKLNQAEGNIEYHTINLKLNQAEGNEENHTINSKRKEQENSTNQSKTDVESLGIGLQTKLKIKNTKPDISVDTSKEDMKEEITNIVSEVVKASVNYENLKCSNESLRKPKTNISTKTIPVSTTTENSRNTKNTNIPTKSNEDVILTGRKKVEDPSIKIITKETKELTNKHNKKSVSTIAEENKETMKNRISKEVNAKNCSKALQNTNHNRFSAITKENEEAIENKEFHSKGSSQNPNKDLQQRKTYQEFRRRQNLRFYKELTKNPNFEINNDLISAVFAHQTNDENFKKFMSKTEPTEEDFILEEERIRKLINRSNNYKPLMGKNALLAKARMEKSDSEIVQELVMQRFSNFLDQYYQRSFQRQSSRQQRGELEESEQTYESLGNFQNFDEDAFEIVRSSTPTGSLKSYRRESGEFIRFSIPSDDFPKNDEELYKLGTPRGSEDCGCPPVKGCFGLRLKSGDKCCSTEERVDKGNCKNQSTNQLGKDQRGFDKKPTFIEETSINTSSRLEPRTYIRNQQIGNTANSSSFQHSSKYLRSNSNFLERSSKEKGTPEKTHTILRQLSQDGNNLNSRPRSCEFSSNIIGLNNSVKANRHSGILETNFDIFENSYETFEPQRKNPDEGQQFTHTTSELDQNKPQQSLVKDLRKFSQISDQRSKFFEDSPKSIKYSDFHKRPDNTNSNLSHLIKQFEPSEINNQKENQDLKRGKNNGAFEESGKYLNQCNSLQRKISEIQNASNKNASSSENKSNKNAIFLETNLDDEFSEALNPLADKTSSDNDLILQTNNKFSNSNLDPQRNNKSINSNLNPQTNNKPLNSKLDHQRNNKFSNSNLDPQTNNKSSISKLDLQRNNKSSNSNLDSQTNNKSSISKLDLQRNNKSSNSNLDPHTNNKSSNSNLDLQRNNKSSNSNLDPQTNNKSSNSNLDLQTNNKSSKPFFLHKPGTFLETDVDQCYQTGKTQSVNDNLDQQTSTKYEIPVETDLDQLTPKTLPRFLSTHKKSEASYKDTPKMKSDENINIPVRSKAFSPSSSKTEDVRGEEIIDFEPSFQSTIARSGSRKSSTVEMTSSSNSLKSAPRKYLTVKVTEINGSLESMQGLSSNKINEREGRFLDQEGSFKTRSNSTLTITDSLELDFKIDDLNLDFLKSTDEHNLESSYEVLETKTEEDNFDDSSDRVSYDARKFLRDALGDAYLSTDSQLISDLDLSENPSIGTSNISDLLSKASSYGVVQTDRPIRRTSTIYEENHYSQNDYTDYVSSSNKLADLILEANVQNQILAQTHKALTLCRKTKEFMASIEEIEAERILLIATIKREALKEEIQKMEYEDLNDSPYKNTGYVRIKGITFPPKPRNSYMPNPFDKRRKEFTHWFVSVLRSGATVFATKPVIPDNDGMVKFDEEFIFDNLSPDFSIVVGIYVIKIKNNVRNYSHESKFHLNKEVKTLCPSPSKLFNLSRDSKNKIQEETSPSSFTLGGKCVIGINNLKDLGYFKLTDMPLVSMLEGTVVINFVTSVTMNEEFSDFLNVGSETGEFITWNRRWCSIKGPYLLYYNYPEDEEPVSKLDLSYCITSYVTSAERTICARPRTLFLETALKGSSEHSPKVVRHFLAADSVNQMKVWETKLNHTVSALRNWNCMKCNFVFSKV